MATETVKVKGYREFSRALVKAEKDTKKRVRAVLKEVGEVIRTDAAGRFGRIDAGSAAGFRVAVRQRGISVEQSRRRTTGNHPQFGAIQMRIALIPAREAKEEEMTRAFERAMDEIALIAERS